MLSKPNHHHRIHQVGNWGWGRISAPTWLCGNEDETQICTVMALGISTPLLGSGRGNSSRREPYFTMASCTRASNFVERVETVREQTNRCLGLLSNTFVVLPFKERTILHYGLRRCDWGPTDSDFSYFTLVLAFINRPHKRSLFLFPYHPLLIHHFKFILQFMEFSTGANLGDTSLVGAS